jgi:hypothetical protein
MEMFIVVKNVERAIKNSFKEIGTRKIGEIKNESVRSNNSFILKSRLSCLSREKNAQRGRMEKISSFSRNRSFKRTWKSY